MGDPIRVKVDDGEPPIGCMLALVFLVLSLSVWALWSIESQLSGIRKALESRPAVEQPR